MSRLVPDAPRKIVTRYVLERRCPACGKIAVRLIGHAEHIFAIYGRSVAKTQRRRKVGDDG